MSRNNILQFLKISAFFVFIGRSYQHLFWDAPFRTFFWDESLLKPIVESLLNISWQDYATHPSTDIAIQNITTGHGFLYLIAAICCLLVKKNNLKWTGIPILLGSFFLILLSLLMMKEKFYHYAQFFEHSIQFGVPLVLYFFIKNNLSTERLVLVLKILIAVAFTSHGLYAFGFYPVPGKFIDMTISCTGISEKSTLVFLKIAGILDFVISVLIFIPKLVKPALLYAFTWGTLTALARIVANFYIDFPVQTIHQNLFSVIYRLPHGIIPLLVYLCYTKGSLRKPF